MSDKSYLEKQVNILGKKKKVWQVCFSICLIFALTAFGLFIRANKSKQAVVQSKYSLLDPLVNLKNKKDLITNVQPVRDYLYELVEKNKEEFNIAIYFEYYNTGANININNELKIWPASLTKLPLAMVVMKKVEKGDWNLNDELVLLEEDLDNKSGELYLANSIGTRFTIEQLLKSLLVDSDNTSYKILYRNISEEDYRELILSIGLEELFDANGKISPKEYSRLLRALYFSTFLELANSEKILEFLSSATFSNYLSKGLPKEEKFAHKYGENIEYNLFSDFGIVYLKDRPYLIAVSIEAKGADKEKNIKKAEELMESISKTTYEYIKNY